MDMNRNVYEGWTPQDFIDELEPFVEQIMAGNAITKPFKTKEDLAKWCCDNQPYYKKKVPEVINYFAKEYNIQ